MEITDNKISLRSIENAQGAFFASKKRANSDTQAVMRCVITNHSTLFMIGDVVGNESLFQHLYSIDDVFGKIVISTCSYLSFCSGNGYEMLPSYVSVEEGTLLEMLFKQTEHYQEIVNNLNNIQDLLLRRRDLFKLCLITKVS